MFPFHRKHNGFVNINSRSYSSGKQNDIKRDDNGEATVEFDEKFYYTQRDPQAYANKETSTLTEKENILKSFLLGNNSTTASSDSELTVNDSPVVSDGSRDSKVASIKYSKRILNSSRSTSPIPYNETFNEQLVIEQARKNLTEFHSDTTNAQIPTILFNGAIENDNDINEELVEKHFNSLQLTEKNSNEERTNSSQGKTCGGFGNTNHNDAKINITTDIEKKVIVNSKLTQSDNGCESQEDKPDILLKKLLLANNKKVSNNWLGEGFVFDKSPSTYGLIQSKDGCSGVVAVVNAYIIKELLFKEEKSDIEYLRPNISQLETALREAMSQILWQAAKSKVTLAMLRNVNEGITTIEDVINNATYVTFISRHDFDETLQESISSFVQPGNHGCLLFLISVILSRGINEVIDDMNGVLTLINSDGYSTSELINLLLSGMAVTNVFDNHIKLNCNIIKGIPKRCDVGYLSIKEHFKYCKVGSYLKTPRFPIWLVHNENHFTLLFSYKKQLLSDWKCEKKFVLTYYDSLKLPGNEIQLVIDTTSAHENSNKRDSIKAFVENCVRTKWKDANVIWK